MPAIQAHNPSMNGSALIAVAAHGASPFKVVHSKVHATTLCMAQEFQSSRGSILSKTPFAASRDFWRPLVAQQLNAVPVHVNFWTIAQLGINTGDLVALEQLLRNGTLPNDALISSAVEAQTTVAGQTSVRRRSKPHSPRFGRLKAVYGLGFRLRVAFPGAVRRAYT